MEKNIKPRFSTHIKPVRFGRKPVRFGRKPVRFGRKPVRPFTLSSFSSLYL